MLIRYKYTRSIVDDTRRGIYEHLSAFFNEKTSCKDDKGF